MASLNKVFLIGNLTRDPELRYIPSGSAVTSFTLAMNRVYKSQTGEKKEEVSFVKVVVWGRLAEVCNDYLKKGRPVFVEGRLQSRNWEAADGQKRSALEVVAMGVQFLGQGSGAGAGSGTRADREAADFSQDKPDDMGEIQLEDIASKGGADDEVPF